MHRCIAPLLLTACLLAGAEDDLVFRSDVSLVRVDVQAVDKSNRAITGLSAEDFVVRESGQPQKISHFGSEDVPVDVLLLLDVSGSMRPHIERVAAASRQALDVLGDDDRVAVMVFDRQSRLRVPFRRSAEAIERELHNLIQQESFDGGTDVTRGLLDAAAWIGREARPEARRAIVILTDDQTERNRDEAGVARALNNSNAVVSALLVPDALGSGRIGIGTGGGGWPRGGGLGGPLGGIILGRRGPLGGGGPVITAPRTRSAGTAEIARRSGGDSMRVDETSALQTTLTRIRQRYALHFHLPDGVKPGQERDIEVELSAAAKRRYPGAEVRYRRMNQADTVVASSAPVPASQPAPEESVQTEKPDVTPAPRQSSSGGWRRADETLPAPAPKAQPAAPPKREAKPTAEFPDRQEEPRKGGWRRVNPGETP